MWLIILVVIAVLFFKYRKQANANYTKASNTKPKTNSFDERMDRLTAEGELPWGWLTQNKAFIDKATAEYLDFFKRYAEHEYGDPLKKYAGLKSLLLYIEEAKVIYAQKGECFLFWFVHTWAQDEQVQKMYAELRYIEEHHEELEKKYKRQQYIEHILIPELKKKAIEVVRENPGIIQTDAYSHFEPEVKSYVQDVFRILSNEGKIKREKHGRTYKLSI